MISPLEVSKKQYAKSINGYKKAEVDEYNQRVSDEMERLINETIDKSEKIKTLQDELDKFNRIEQNLRDALIIAQRTHDEVIKSANDRSDLIVRESEARAKEIIRAASDEGIQIAKQHEEAKKDFIIFRTRYKTLLKSQLDLIEDYNID
ncbi:MAG: DivIVA domain-containing protein [Acidaminobacteraceae bacterium]